VLSHAKWGSRWCMSIRVKSGRDRLSRELTQINANKDLRSFAFIRGQIILLHIVRMNIFPLKIYIEPRNDVL